MKHIIMERFNYSGLWIKYSKFYESGYGHANRSNKRPMIMKINIGNKKLFLIRHVRKFGKKYGMILYQLLIFWVGRHGQEWF